MTKMIDIDTADALSYSGYVQKNFVSHGRWALYYQIIFEEDGKFWEFEYEVPATEMQDGMDYQTELKCFEVVPKIVETTIFERVE